MNESTVPAVVANNLVKKFMIGEGVVTALNGVSLSMEKGDFVAVMGASGSGKSTLLHVLGALTSLDQGTVELAGKTLARMSDKKLTEFRRDSVGFIFQSFNLLPTLTVEENIMLPILAGNKTAVSEEKMESLLSLVGLKHRRHHRPEALSGGEQQRVAIARALVTEPDLILADEPTGNLDSVNSEKICDILSDLNEREKRTILLVTHEPLVAMRAHRIIILKDGQVIADHDRSEFKNAQELALCYQNSVQG